MMLSSALFLAAIVAAVTAAPPHQGKIVGGSPAELGEFPYVVSLQRHGSHTCGGSILSEDYILTAAHCIVDFEVNPTGLQIQYGLVDIESDENIIDVKLVIKHKGFKPEINLANDIAVLKLSEKIKFGPTAQPVHLPNSHDYPGDFANAVLVGWGRIGTGKPISNLLLKVDLILFTHSYCQSKENNYIPESNVCVGVPEGGKGSCNGDSGGPLTVNGVQYGLVSWAVHPCSSFGHPGIETSVVAFRDWIKEHSGV